jgi:hypothetical protein
MHALGGAARYVPLASVVGVAVVVVVVTPSSS